MTQHPSRGRLQIAATLTVIAGLTGTIPPVAATTAQDTPALTMFGRPDIAEVRRELLDWVARATTDATVIREVAASWSEESEVAGLPGEQLLDRLVESFALADPATDRLVRSTWGPGPLEVPVMDGVRDAPVYRNHVNFYQARWLAQHRFFDEALEIFDRLAADEIVDPAGLFFYRAVCQSELLLRDAALDSLSLLLEHTFDVPTRFRTVATILKNELGERQEEGLGHVARLMSDVGRRLDLGRTGERVQKREDDVITALDRLLEELEKQNQQDQQQSSGQGGGQNGQGRPSGQPAPDSYRNGIAGEGEADRRNVEETGSWGMLDRKEEAKAREFIQQQFPANFLDIISEYSRRIAEQE